jgi:hypothetical protein
MQGSRSKRIALMLGTYAAGLPASMAAIFAVFQLPSRFTDVAGLALVWPWWLITKYGTRLLPDSVTAPYDPVGHPLLHALGVAVNGLYMAVLLYLLLRRYLDRAFASEDKD